MSLRTRLSLEMASLVLVLVAATSFAIYRVADRSLRTQVDDFLRDRVATVSARLNDMAGGPLRGRRVRNPLGDALLDARFDVSSQVIGPNGEVVLVIGEEVPVTDRDREIAQGEQPTFRDTELRGAAHRVYVVPIEGGGALLIARDVSEIGSAMSDIRNWLVAVGAVLVAFAALASWWMARVVTAPLRDLSLAANDIAGGASIDTPVAERGASEVRSLAQSLNLMLRRIKSSFDRERQFVQDASHELRTPLTSLRVNTELLERPEIGEEERRRILGDIRSEVDALTAISSELATLAADQRVAEDPIDISLGDAVSVVVERVRRRSGRNIAITGADESGTASATSVLSLRLSQFERALGNLLDNAVKFSPTDTAIEVVVAGGAVSVVDHGLGIADEEKPHIFTRFYRSAATRAMPGSGLGLSIVEQFARDHDATVDVSDTTGGGATFTLRFSRGAEGN
ncbi:MAG: ATP-binding protein [Actinomycetota bacterium]